MVIPWPPPRLNRKNRWIFVFGLVGALVAGAVMLWGGIFFAIEQHTGLQTTATVGDCEVTGAGRNQSTHCTGTWIVGGSLLDGGHVIYGDIEDADPSQVGKDIPVSVHGDTAYTHEPILPAMLIGFGLVWFVAAAFIVRALQRISRMPPT
ncbi:MAG TPA: hypothetical protein VHT05_01305 [Candidatus Elarobacter sp.]|nr:hypothetical protein [Candidatus Elarobacter sp.]